MTTDINLPGLTIDAATFAELRQELRGLVAPGALVVLAGSLPQGIGDGAYADLVAELKNAGTRVVLDASNAPLAAALAAPDSALPFCIKPNRHELEDWAGRDLADPRDLVAAARSLHQRGIGLVVVSLGAAGALFVSAEGAVQASLPAVRAPSTVGAGDAMVAGIVAALCDGGPLDALARLATAFAVGKLRRTGPYLPDPETVRTLAATAAVIPADAWAAAAAAEGR